MNTCDTMELFHEEIEKIYQFFYDNRQPARVTGAYSPSKNTGTILYGYFVWNPLHESLYSTTTGFEIDKDYFWDSIRDINQRLLDAGLLVNSEWTKGATHVFTVTWGTNASTKLPAKWSFFGKMTDDEAVLTSIKTGFPCVHFNKHDTYDLVDPPRIRP